MSAQRPRGVIPGAVRQPGWATRCMVATLGQRWLWQDRNGKWCCECVVDDVLHRDPRYQDGQWISMIDDAEYCDPSDVDGRRIMKHFLRVMLSGFSGLGVLRISSK